MISPESISVGKLNSRKPLISFCYSYFVIGIITDHPENLGWFGWFHDQELETRETTAAIYQHGCQQQEQQHKRYNNNTNKNSKNSLIFGWCQTKVEFSNKPHVRNFLEKLVEDVHLVRPLPIIIVLLLITHIVYIYIYIYICPLYF